MTSAHTRLEFHILHDGANDSIAVLILNRPAQANAFSAQMMEEISFHLQTVERRVGCRCLIISGSGKHFSAGADLAWMKDSAKLSLSENVKDASRLSQMFEALNSLPIPTIAAIKGAVYGGGIGLVACCDFAVAHSSAQFCLSEARLGLIPAVIFPYLGRKVKPGQLKRLSLSAKVFSAEEALQYGLIEVLAGETFDAVLRSEINNILSCGPDAQKSLKQLYSTLRQSNFKQSDITQEAIADVRTSPEGQAGLTAFFEKTTPPWLATLPHDVAPTAYSTPIA